MKLAALAAAVVPNFPSPEIMTRQSCTTLQQLLEGLALLPLFKQHTHIERQRLTERAAASLPSVEEGRA